MDRSDPTLVSIIREAAQKRPDELAYRFLVDGDTDELTLNHSQLERGARAVASMLRAAGLSPGDRALLLYPPGLDYLIGFLGCLFAGVIAVPAYPPDPGRLGRTLPRILAIISDCGAAAVMTTDLIAAMKPMVAELAPSLDAMCWIATDAPVAEMDFRAATWQPRSPARSDIAFLQYTSGSTGSPKGVVLSHGNLVHNFELMRNAMRTTRDSHAVIWLPPYHDMGLIGGILQPLYVGYPATLMSPMTFLQKPMAWPRAISRFGGTISGGPNFAYDLCVRRSTPAERAELDLSHWDVAFSGAETVRHETIERFAAAFEPAGFRRTSIYPCYGLAEGTLIVSGGEAHAGAHAYPFDRSALSEGRAEIAAKTADDAAVQVSCGRPLGDQLVRIVDAKTQTACADGVMGEIWVSGSSVAQGYWGRPEQTADVFGGRIPDLGEGPFLRTGDLGFLRDGELFITGRSKDLVIIRGRNHYPQDLEATVEASHWAVRPGCVAAFAVHQGAGERLVIVAEFERRHRPDRRLTETATHVDRRASTDRRQDDYEAKTTVAVAPEVADSANKDVELTIEERHRAVIEAVRQAIAEEHGLPVAAVVLVKAGTIPKTSSGKIQRHATKTAYLEHHLDVLDVWTDSPHSSIAPARLSSMAPSVPTGGFQTLEETTSWLLARFASLMRLSSKTVDVRVPITRYGLDSLRTVELVNEIEMTTGVALPIGSLIRGPTLVDLAAQVFSSLRRPDRSELVPTNSEPLVSAGQRALWFIQRTAPQSTAYSIHRAVWLGDGTDLAALRAAFQDVVDRHESLRTTFEEVDGEPRALVEAQREVHFVEEDGAGWSTDAVRARFGDLMRVPFDLGTGPLLRIHVVRGTAEGTAMLLSIHHTITDFWSLSIMVSELATAYGMRVRGTRPVLEAPSLRYSDVERWKRARLEGPEGETLRTYWERELSGELPVLALPVDRPRPAVRREIGGATVLQIRREVLEGLRARARANDTTLFVTLLTLYSVFLARHTGQSSLIIGAPFAGRTRAAMSDLFGYFVNMLPLRVDLSNRPKLTELLRRVRTTVEGALAHQEMPLSEIVARRNPGRDARQLPLFQTAFVLQQTPVPELESLTGLALDVPGVSVHISDLELRSFPIEHTVPQFDLMLFVTETAGSLNARFEYDAEIFDASTIQRMASRFESILEHVVANPDERVDDIATLTEDDRALLRGWNATERLRAWSGGLHTQIEAQLAQRPDAIAVTSEERTLTNRALDAETNQLARRLRALGVTDDAYVGVVMERDADMVVALLAILKAGAAYVPIDPEYPEARLRYVLQDSGVRVVLTQQKWLDRLRGMDVAHVVAVDAAAERARTARESTATLAMSVAPSQLAYMIYTSGSTGRPKGAMNTHVGILNRLHWMQDRFGLTADDVVLQKTPFGFDVSVWEFFWPLLTGARIVMARPGGHREPRYLADTMKREGVTTLHFVPSMLSAYLSDASIEVPACVRRVMCSGEALPYELQERFFARAPSAELHNLYGPTEAAVDVTHWACERDSVRKIVPIGRPIANTQTHVLDARMRRVPVGVTGELYLGGIQLARGYHGRPQLTAERFVPDPFGAPGDRLYRTGDLARWLPDGSVEYLGRVDFQVKIRGFRIELGEIESALLQTGWIRECVVTARPTIDGDKQLVAYLVSSQPSRRATMELREALLRTLPDYMVPSVFVWLDALPLNSSGKVDRGALPAPESAARGESQFVAPRNEREHVLAEIWREILSVPRVGIDDHFFELGGHSLLATRVISRVRRAFGCELPVRAIFTSPTVRALADVIAAATATAHVAIERADRTKPMRASFAQERLWFLDRLTPGSAAYNMPAAVELKGRLDVDALCSAIRSIVERHEVLRTNLVADDQGVTQVVHLEPRFGWSVEDVTDGEVPARIEALARAPFSLERGPVLNATLLRTSETHHVLVLVMHHVAGDGWSFDVIVRELAALYKAGSEGRDAALSPLPIQYADFAVWQRDWLRAERLDASLAYWKGRLADAPPTLDLPSDRPRPTVKSDRGASVAVALSSETSAGVHRLARDTGATPFMVLLSAWAALLGRHAGQQDVVVGTPIANRTRAEIEPLIGCFVNTLALRVDFSGDPSVRELLSRVKQMTLGAYEHQDVPFERVVEILNVPRDTSRTPVFQTMFALQNTRLTALELPDLELRLIERESSAAKFDLTLTLFERPSGFYGSLEYDTGLFDKATIERFVDRFMRLANALVGAPDARIGDIEMIEPAERARIDGWSRAESPTWPHGSLHGLVEAQAVQTPDAVAVVTEQRALSFRQLNTEANKLAAWLRQRGVGANALVGVCMDRSLEMVVAMLATLKAGGAYVPIDPEYPVDRIEYMLKDSGVGIVLTQRHVVASRAQDDSSREWVALDGEPRERPWDRLPEDNASDAFHPEQPAYMIYTSGSTGQPKGALVPHRAIVNHTHWMQSEFPLHTDDAVLQKTAISFDASVWEFWSPLAAGARVVMAPPGAHRDARNLVELVKHHHITTLQLVPTMLGALLDEPDFSTCTSLRRVFCGGEVLTHAQREAFQLALPEATLTNLYGPTETAIDTVYHTTKSDRASAGPVPIGRPVSRVRAHILDRGMRPAPIGVAGELFLGGEQVGLGYHARRALTAERFVPDPFGNTGERLYRTGDVARWRADGVIEYLGRRDAQVKIRGFRIELGEIEAALRRVPDVRDAIVLLRGDADSKTRVVAYLVGAHDASSRPSSEDLRARLRRSLTDAMVPSAFVWLDAFPLLPNGKVDRNGLLRIALDTAGTAFAAPTNPLEQALAGIWSEVLGVPRVGIDDDFFDLGGHSLLATRIVDRISRDLQKRVPVQTMFTATTVRRLSLALENDSPDAAESGTLRRRSKSERLEQDRALRRKFGGGSNG